MVGILGPTFPYTLTGYNLARLFRKFAKSSKDDSRTGYLLFYKTLETYSDSWMKRYNPYHPTRCGLESKSIEKPDLTVIPISRIPPRHRIDLTSSKINSDSNSWSSIDQNSFSRSTSIQNEAKDTPSPNTYSKNILLAAGSLTIQNPQGEIPENIIISNSVDISGRDDGITPTTISVEVVCALEVVTAVKENTAHLPTNVNAVSGEGIVIVDSQHSISTNHDDSHERDANMRQLVVAENATQNHLHTEEIMPFGLQPSQTTEPLTHLSILDLGIRLILSGQGGPYCEWRRLLAAVQFSETSSSVKFDRQEIRVLKLEEVPSEKDITNNMKICDYGCIVNGLRQWIKGDRYAPSLTFTNLD
jgi:hypothetical protein